ncbi:hypothetical protein RCL_jg16514.t1 [Rhizophagus clarus]|uniref:NADH dehydrogenase [ubiquinone] 1 alpha subcomplex subunit 11 n=1 Tax=Rhizophagus clarus TaxID=94130 RepID=A0A8H3QRH1_9GLOM|nr:hypothetical protein RCL_jg16514.t1 [Rhizophagus clarus]
MSSTANKDDVYHEKELILNSLKTSLGFAGFALLGGIFTATETLTANIRKTDDWINGAVGGCATGLTIGIRARSHKLGVGACLGIGGLMSLYEFSGAWKGLLRYKNEDEKSEWRRKIFKDNNQIINEE